MTLSGRQRTEFAAWLERQGYHLSLIDDGGKPMVQWWRGDGLKLPRLLPADAYHLQLYRNKGWSLIAPPEVGPGQTVHWDAQGWQISGAVPGQTDSFTSFEPGESVTDWAIVTKEFHGETEAKKHVCRFNRAIGSPCKEPGCPRVRVKPYQRREPVGVTKE